MAELKLAGNFVNVTAGIGLFGHLQIVFADSASQLEIEVQSEFLLFGNWQYGTEIDHADGSNFEVPGLYAETTIDIGNRNPENVWEILLQAADNFQNSGIGISYHPLQNSNAYINTLFNMVGLDLNQYLPQATPLLVFEFPSSNVDVIEQKYAIPFDLNGTTDNDIIRTGAGNDRIDGKDGNDELSGGRGIDILIGGAGDDFLEGGDGDDRFVVGEGNDIIIDAEADDRLFVYASLFGIPDPDPNDDELPLFPLLGGVASYFNQLSFDGSEVLFDGTLDLDQDQDGNIEYFFTTEKVVSVETGEFFYDYGNLKFFDENTFFHFYSIMYEMDGNDLIITINLDDGTNETDSQVTIQDYSAGDLGINLAGPIHLGDDHDDGDSIGDPAGIAAHNAAVDYIANQGQLLDDSVPSPNQPPSSGTSGDDVFDGTIFNDVYSADSGSDTLNGNAGDDELHGEAGNDILNGGDGNDLLDGGSGNDTIVAGGGDDRIIGGSGAGDDSYDGGEGIDTLVYSSTSAGVVVDLASGTATGIEIDNDTLSSIETVIGGAGSDLFIDADADNQYDGGDGVDTVSYAKTRENYVVVEVPGGYYIGEKDPADSEAPALQIDALKDIEFVSFDGVAFDIASLVEASNAAPVAVADSGFATDEGQAVTILASALLANDTDADDDTLTIVSVQDAANGSVALDINGDVVFTPDADYAGPASFTYTISDGDLTSTASVDLTVNESVPVATAATVMAEVDEGDIVAPGALLWTINDPTPTADGFGGAVAIDNGRLLVGAAGDDTNGTNVGQAHLYDAVTGALLQTFDDPTPTTRDAFGNSVALSGNHILIGARSDDTNGSDVGQAHLFDATTGALLQTFDEPTPTTDSSFGISVAVDGNRVLVGSSRDSTNGSAAGQAHLFDAATGALLQTFDDPTPTTGGEFGFAVAIDGDRVIIGAQFDATNGLNVGQVHLFDAITGALIRTFDDPTPTMDGFGHAVAVAGDWLLIAAPFDDTNGANVGQVHLFDINTGVLLRTFDDPAPAANNNFGWSIALSDDTVLIAARGDDTNGSGVGRAYLFDANTGALLETYDDPTPTVNDQFGQSVALEGNLAVIGANDDDTAGTNIGQAHLFSTSDGAAVSLNLTTLVDFGADGLAVGGGFGLSSDTSGLLALTSDGQNILYDATGDTLTGFVDSGTSPGVLDAGDTTVFTLSVDPAGSATFTLLEEIDHGIGPDPLPIDFSSVIEATDGDGDTITLDAGQLVFKVKNDTAPVIAAPAASLVDEDDLPLGIGDAAAGDDATVTDIILDGDADATTVAGSLDISWGDDDANPVVNGGPGAGDRGVTFAADAIATLTALSLTSKGDALGYALSSGDTVLTATAGGRTVFTATLSDELNGSYLFDLEDTLDHPTANTEDNIDLGFTFTATDSNGDATDASFTVTVDDDLAVVTAAAVMATVDEADIGSAVGMLLQTLDDPTPTSSDNFGRAVAIDGGRVLVGARGDDAGGTDTGQAHLFDAATGALLQTFDDPNPTTADFFGDSAALSGNYALIGAPNDDTNGTQAGQAYLFDATTGVLLQTFDDPTPAASDVFGISVAIESDFVLIGAAFDNTNGVFVGQAHLFDAITGALIRTFDDPTPTTSDQFGRSVAISGDRVLIGAQGDQTNGEAVGQVHLFDATTGTLLRTFDNPTPTPFDGFGQAVAINGDLVLIGASQDDTNGTNVGQAYLFDATTGVLLQTFDDPTPTAGDDFGFSVAMSGDKALIGAQGDNTNGQDIGQAYLFDINTGALLEIFDDPTLTARDVFGQVAIDGNQIVIGAHLDDTNGLDVGQAHLFDVNASDPQATLDLSTLVDFGADGPGSGGGFSLGSNLSALPALTSDGQNILYDATGNILTGFVDSGTSPGVLDAGDTTVFTLSVDPAGSATFTLFEELDHPLGSDPLPIDFSSVIEATDGDGDVITLDAGQLVFKVKNDTAPIIATPAASLVDEDDLALGIGDAAADDDVTVTDVTLDGDADATTVAGSLDISWGDDDANPVVNGVPGAGDRGVTFASDAIATLIALSLTSQGDALGYVLSTGDTVLTATAGGRTIFTATLSDALSGSYLFDLEDTLDHPTSGTEDNIDLGFAFTATDSNSDTTDAIFTITVDDDLAVVTAAAVMATVDEAGIGSGPVTLARTFDDPTPTTSDLIGRSVAIDNGRVLLGANGDDTNGPNVGQAYLFDTATGALLQTFDDPTPTTGDGFGIASAIDGNLVLIGAGSDDTNGTNVGQAHLFDASTGALIRTFDDPTPTTADNFGEAVAIDGNHVLIGAAADDTKGSNIGQVHLFDVTTGALLQTFDDPTPTANDQFGRSVAISGNHALIGTPADDTNGTNVGQVHLFDATTGALLRTFDDPTPTGGDLFGVKVAMSGDWVLVGAPSDDTNGANVGQVHLFDINTGLLLRTFDDPTPTTSDIFGAAVAIDGNQVVIGARGDDTNGTNIGQVHVFDAATGVLLETIDDPTPTTTDSFGTSVSVEGNQVIIGATGDDTNGPLVGQAHLFSTSNDTESTLDLSSLVNFGADGPAAGGGYGLGTDTSGLAALASDGEAIIYSVDGNTLTGFVDSGTSPGVLDAGDTTVFTLSVDPSGSATFTLLQEIDHPLGSDPLPIDFSSVIEATDADGDVITLDAGQLVFKVTDGDTSLVRLFDVGGNLVNTFTTIQAAVDAASTGFTVLVLPGTYNENVIIDQSISLLSSGGRDVTIIDGVQAGSELGTIEIDPNVDDVTIGAVGQGFTIRGIDGTAGLEKAAVYLQGNHDNVTIQGNDLVARGDSALTSEYAAAVTNTLIDSNIISGQTFDGANPAGDGFGAQFTLDDVPRQLVVMGNGNNPSPSSNNITFSNNDVTGTAGGTSTTDNTGATVAAHEQGNTLVTIDAASSSITGNTFTGFTNRFGVAIRARGPETDIEDNTLDHSSGGSSHGMTVDYQGLPGTYSGNELIGGSGDEVIFNMTPGDDTLTGNGGNDVLIGGNGDDTFIFTSGDGDDWIADFEAGAASDDVIELDNISGFTQFSDVTAATSQNGSDAVIDLGTDDSITLAGIDMANLHADDFRFV